MRRRRPETRDYLYVSVRKIERLSAALPQRTLKRLQELHVSAGPVSAGFSLADASKQDLISVVSDVEAAIRRDHDVRAIDDPDLRVGHFMSADTLDMAYGVQRTHGDQGPGAAVFGMSRADGFTLFLSGSAEYLLDRRVPDVDAGQSMSAPDTIGSLLASVSEDVTPHGNDGDYWRDSYAASSILNELTSRGVYPMSFLARVLRIRPTDGIAGQPPSRLVIGTPLWVAMAVPD